MRKEGGKMLLTDVDRKEFWRESNAVSTKVVVLDSEKIK